MEKFYTFQSLARSIAEQIRELAARLEGDEDMREYANIFLERCFTPEDDALIITMTFIEYLLFRPYLEG